MRRGDIVDSLRMGWKVPEQREREINNVGDCGDEYRRTFFEKLSQVGIGSKSDCLFGESNRIS